MTNPKKNLRKESWERTSGTTKWEKLGQVGVRGTSGTRRRGFSDLSGTSGTSVPNGTTRPRNLFEFVRTKSNPRTYQKNRFTFWWIPVAFSVLRPWASWSGRSIIVTFLRHSASTSNAWCWTNHNTYRFPLLSDLQGTFLSFFVMFFWRLPARSQFASFFGKKSDVPRVGLVFHNQKNSSS